MKEIEDDKNKIQLRRETNNFEIWNRESEYRETRKLKQLVRLEKTKETMRTTEWMEKYQEANCPNNIKSYQ